MRTPQPPAMRPHASNPPMANPIPNLVAAAASVTNAAMRPTPSVGAGTEKLQQVGH